MRADLWVGAALLGSILFIAVLVVVAALASQFMSMGCLA